MFGGKGRHHRIYSAPLIDRLNTRCQQLFGETVEENFRAPANVPSDELLGLEYLFSQSTGDSEPFSLKDIVNDGPGPEEEVVQYGQPDPDPEADEAYQSDGEAHGDVLDAILPHITLTSDETSTVNPPAFVSNCGSGRIKCNALIAGQCAHLNLPYLYGNFSTGGCLQFKPPSWLRKVGEVLLCSCGN